MALGIQILRAKFFLAPHLNFLATHLIFDFLVWRKGLGVALGQFRCGARKFSVYIMFIGTCSKFNQRFVLKYEAYIPIFSEIFALQIQYFLKFCFYSWSRSWLLSFFLGQDLVFYFFSWWKACFLVFFFKFPPL